MNKWIMRRLLSINRAAASQWFKAPDDGRKWTISALAYAGSLRGAPWALERIAFIDRAFWPGHCQEAFEATVAGEPQETGTWRSRRGALRVLWALVTGQWLRLMK